MLRASMVASPQTILLLALPTRTMATLKDVIEFLKSLSGQIREDLE